MRFIVPVTKKKKKKRRGSHSSNAVVVDYLKEEACGILYIEGPARARDEVWRSGTRRCVFSYMRQ